MPTTLEFWFEFGSTYSHPTAQRIEALCERAGVPLTWHPFLLGPIFRAQGWNDSPFNLYPAKGRYMWRDIERLCAAYSLPFQRPSHFPRNGLLPARIAAAHRTAPWLPDFVRAVYRANFALDQDISDPQVLTTCLPESAGPPEPILATAQTPLAKDTLRHLTEEATQRGIFGAPSFFVANELFWGDDRLTQAIASATAPP